MADNKLHEYLQPILGSAYSTAVIECLEGFHPKLKDNVDWQNKFIKEIDKVPPEDRNFMVAAAIKISKIREVLDSRGDNSEFKDSYSDFANITTRLLKNFYNMAKYADLRILDPNLSDEEKLSSLDSPIFSARTIVFNDSIDKSVSSVEQAKTGIDMLVRSSAGGMGDFPKIVEYIAETSGRAAEIVFDHKEFRNFSKFLQNKTLQNAQEEALTGKKSMEYNPIKQTGIQYG